MSPNFNVTRYLSPLFCREHHKKDQTDHGLVTLGTKVSFLYLTMTMVELDSTSPSVSIFHLSITRRLLPPCSQSSVIILHIAIAFNRAQFPLFTSIISTFWVALWYSHIFTSKLNRFHCIFNFLPSIVNPPDVNKPIYISCCCQRAVCIKVLRREQ